MYGCYRKAEADDATIFLDAAAAILSDYPDEVILLVTDPRTGIPGKLKWPPQPSEVKEACEAAMAPIRRLLEAEDRERRIAAQLAQRALEPPPESKPSKEELEAKLGRKISARPQGTGPAHIEEGDGQHMNRCMADLAARKARRQASIDVKPTL
jgi:hypothetical protein